MTREQKLKYGLIGLIFGILMGLFFITQVFATQPEKVTWCHCEPNGNCQTLELPMEALENAGHVNASGNSLHAGDYAGVCQEEEEEVCDEQEPTPTEEITPTVEVTPTEEPTPTQEPRVTPTEEPKQGGDSPKPENPNDGRSDGRVSTPQPTIPPCVYGQSGCGWK